MKPVGAAKPDWWAVSSVAKKMGFGTHFDYDTAADIFREHASLSAFENEGRRDFDLGGLFTLSDADYQRLSPIQWPVNSRNPSGSKRMFEDRRFFTPSGKAQFVVSTASLADAVAGPCRDRELVLNTGRLRDQWHTMTRMGHAPKLTSHDDVAFIELNAQDAVRLGLKNQAIANVFNDLGELALQVKVSESIEPGQAFMPIHWSSRFASASTANVLVQPRVDPVSGQPEFKATKISIQPLVYRYWARIVSVHPLKTLKQYGYWSTNQFESGWVTLLGYDQAVDWKNTLLSGAVLSGSVSENGEVIEYHNPLTAQYVAATYCGENIDALIFEGGCASDLPSRAWMAESVINSKMLDSAVLVRGERGDRDQLICSCFGITKNQIRHAIDHGAQSISDLANVFGAGSKCGSCKPELNQLFSKAN